MATYFNLPFGIRISKNEPIDGDRYKVDNISERDLLITEDRAFDGLQVFDSSTKTLYILKDTINSTWGTISTDASDLTSKLNNTTDTFNGTLTINGSINLFGNFTQEGSVYVTHAENIYTTKDFITLRDGALLGLTDGSISGLRIMFPNGTNNLLLGTDNDAILRIGWEGDSLQAIATREDAPTNGYYAYWDEASTMFKTYDLRGHLDSSFNILNNHIISIDSSIIRIDSSLNDIVELSSLVYDKTYVDGSLNSKLKNTTDTFIGTLTIVGKIDTSILEVDSSVYFNGIKNASTNKVVYYDEITKEISYADASFNGLHEQVTFNSLTGFTLTGQQISYTANYSLPLTADTAKGVTAHGWGNHAGLYAALTHVHGNISNIGAIGNTAGLIIKTGTDGVLTAMAAGSSGQFLAYDGNWAIPQPSITYVDGSLLYIRATYIPDASLNTSKFKWIGGYLEPSIASGTGDVTKLYVDGSLAARDTSIGNLNSRLNTTDTSLNTLLGRYNKSDASIGTLTTRLNTTDSSLNTLLGRYNKSDASIGTLTTRVNNLDGSVAEWNAAYNDKINSASFNTGDGVITLTQQDSGTITVDIDGRYSTTDTNYYPTSFAWTGGTTAGPTGSLSGSGMSAVSYAAIPSATDSASGIVTTTTQTFAGDKTFSGVILASNGSVSAPSFSFSSDSNTGFYWTTAGQIKVANDGVNNFMFDVSTFHADGNIIAYSGSVSDIRLKENIINIDGKKSLDILNSFNSIEYTHKRKKSKHSGFIAQEVEKVLPHIITEYQLLNEDPSIMYKTINYTEIIPYLVSVIKYQQEQISNLYNLINK